MANITAALVKELRETSGAGMMDCKKALTETDGDLQAAVDWLRTKGLAAAAKKAGRVAAEGLVAVMAKDGAAVAVEVNAETDFVARNEQFQGLVNGVAQVALAVGGDADAVRAAHFPGSERTVTEEVTHLVATIGENMTFRRSVGVSVAQGVVATYVHSAVAPGLGKIGVLVAVESTGDKARLEALGKQLAMHVAAASPQFLDRASVDPAVLDRERAVQTEKAIAEGKPAEMAAKIVDGRIRKFYEEICLLEQVFVIDGKTKVQAVIDDLAKELGTPVTVTGYVRFVLGDGIEKEEKDFAAEVAATLNA